MGDSVSDRECQIVGAGLAGLVAAIALARAGRLVVVHEASAGVSSRFQGDFQGLENWTTRNDVLDELRGQGIACTFASIAGIQLPYTPLRYLNYTRLGYILGARDSS